jgi:antitoxin HicB
MTKLKYQMVIQWSDEDGCFLVGFLDFAGQRWRTHGDTYELAVANGIEALESLMLAYEATGESLPEPTVCNAVWRSSDAIVPA